MLDILLNNLNIIIDNIEWLEVVILIILRILLDKVFSYLSLFIISDIGVVKFLNVGGFNNNRGYFIRSNRDLEVSNISIVIRYLLSIIIYS